MSLISLRVYSYLLRLICQLRPQQGPHAHREGGEAAGRGVAVAGVCCTKSSTIAAIEKVQRELGSASRLCLLLAEYIYIIVLYTVLVYTTI